jgi:putative transposase
MSAKCPVFPQNSPTSRTGTQARQARAQRNHIGLSIRAFLRLEYHRFTTGVSWFAAKAGIIRDAVRAYLAQPLYRLTGTA